jgi:chemotaxis protein histidine kinase CheA
VSLSEEVRARLLASFRAELAEHIQTITDGLLALEQQTVAEDQRQPLLEDLFRAAHSLKGAARAIGLTSIEQLAHALEDVLNGLQKNTLSFSSALFTACYETLDAIRLVQAMFESGSSTPPREALQPSRPWRPSSRTLKPQRRNCRSRRSTGAGRWVARPDRAAREAPPWRGHRSTRWQR